MRYADVPLALQTRRIVSVDALRGFSIFWIMGGDGAVLALDRMLKDKGQPVPALVPHRSLGLSLLKQDCLGQVPPGAFQTE
jgi:hypothetical protein